MSEKKLVMTRDAKEWTPSIFPLPTRMVRQISQEPLQKTNTPIVIPKRKFGYVDSYKLYQTQDGGAGTYITIPHFYEYLSESECLSSCCKDLKFNYNPTLPINEIIISFVIQNDSGTDIPAHISFHPPGRQDSTHIRSPAGTINYVFVSIPEEKQLFIEKVNEEGRADFNKSAELIIECINYILEIYYDELFITHYPLLDEINIDLNKKIAQFNNYNSNVENIDSYIRYLSTHRTFGTEINRQKISEMLLEKESLYQDIMDKLEKTPEEFSYELDNHFVLLDEDAYYKKYIKYKNKYQNLKKVIYFSRHK